MDRLAVEIQWAKSVQYFKYLVFLVVLLAFCCWQAPLAYRFLALFIILLLEVFYCFWALRAYAAIYPAKMYFTGSTWFLSLPKAKQLIPVRFGGWTCFNPYFSTLQLLAVDGKKYTLVLTATSFGQKTEYHRFIRFVKIHPGAF